MTQKLKTRLRVQRTLSFLPIIRSFPDGVKKGKTVCFITAIISIFLTIWTPDEGIMIVSHIPIYECSGGLLPRPLPPHN